MTSSGDTIWELVRQGAETLPEPFSRAALVSWVSKRRPDVELSSISTHIQYAIAEAPNREGHNLGIRPPLLTRVDRGLYRRYRAAGPSSPVSVARPDPVLRVPVGDACTDVVLVGCTRSKAPTARPAADLFTGARFTKARDLAMRSGKPWFVLSAKFGLLAPDELIAPYDVYLPDQSAEYREAWGRWVTAQLAARHPLRGAVVEIHAGQAYCEPLRRPLEAAGAVLRLPLAGLRQGEQLAYYDRPTHRSVAPQEPVSTALPDVSYLLDERNAVPPNGFLARGRSAADAPGLYSWWVDDAGAQALSVGLGHHVAQGLIYAGRAGGQRPNGKVSTNTLWGRIGGMHLGGNRNFSTFRLTLTAALRHSSVGDEAELSRWMHDHLRVAVLPLQAQAVFAAEERLLALTDPPLNLQGVPATPLRRALSRLRSELSAEG